MPDFLFFINEVLWGSIMIYLLLGAGIWFTLRSGFIQFRYIRKFGRSLKNSVTPQPGGLTSSRPSAPALPHASAAVIWQGGTGHQRRWPGRRFLDVGHGAYRDGHLLCRKRPRPTLQEKDKNGQFRGGPAWYMARGLGMRWMGVLFSLFLLLAYGLIFNTVQANSVAHALRYAFACPEWITGLVLALCILLTISTGLKVSPA